jgi:hypothetical protein
VPTLQASAPATTTAASPESSGGHSGPLQTTTAAPARPITSPPHWSGQSRSPSQSAASTATKRASVLASTAARPAPAWAIPQKVAP